MWGVVILRGVVAVNNFWRFAKLMLLYKRSLGLAAMGLGLDALCAFAGFGVILVTISEFADVGGSAREIIMGKLSSEKVVNWIGDQSSLAEVVPEGRIEGFAALFGVVFLVALVGSVGRFTHQYHTLTASMRTVLRIRKMAFGRLVHLPMGIATGEGTGDRLSRVVRDTQVLTGGFTALFSKAVRDMVMGMVALMWAFLLDWRLTGIFLVGFPVMIILIRYFGKKIRRAVRRSMVQYGHMVGTILEALQGLRVVKVHHAEGYERRRFSQINRRVFEEEMKARIVRAISSPSIELLVMMGLILMSLAAIWYMGQTDAAGETLLDGGVLIAVVGALGLSASSFRTLANLNNTLQTAAAAADRIEEVLELPTEQTARQEHTNPNLYRMGRHDQSVTLEDIVFTYPGCDEPTLKGLSFEAPVGSVCAIVGGNGSGKSTLLGLIPRLYEPDSGRVLVDGKDIADATLRSLRRQMAVVTQDTVLFDGSIADNIIYGTRHATREQMIDAAKHAHAHEFIEQMPDGYATEIGERGARLSGGQRQRIAIARAILRDPAILILDEATSQIDADSEAKINEALEEFMANRTTFVIAHRLSTVINADMIVVMKDGGIEAIGKHGELLESSGVYKMLCRTQMGQASD